jgi:hypothetical protein
LSPAIDDACGPGTSTAGTGRDGREDARRVERLDADQLRAGVVGVRAGGSRRQRADTDLDRHVRRLGRSGLGQLLGDLVEDGGVALDDPPRDPVVPGPGRVGE